MNADTQGRRRRWTFLTPHGHALLLVARDPRSRVRDLAQQLGLTERATQSLLRDLVEEGYLSVSKSGRRNVYEVRPDLPLRHPLFQHHRVRELIETLSPAEPAPSSDR